MNFDGLSISTDSRYLHFYQRPEVINDTSDLLVELLGSRGRHARSALGTCNLSMNIPVEIEMIVRIRPAQIQ